MAFNGSGTYSIPSSFYPKTAGQLIKAEDWNAFLEDIRDALNKTLLRDGQAAVTQNIDFGTKKVTNLGNGTLSTDAVNKGQMDAGDAATLASATALSDLPTALTTDRSAPHANFSWFTSDFTVTLSGGFGKAAVNEDIVDVFLTKFGGLMSGVVSYVHPSGNDGNTGINWRQAFLTPSQAIRSTSNGTIYLWPGTYDICDFRYTDTAGDKPKRIVAPFGGVTLRVSGDNVSTATWTLDGDYAGMYNMHVTSTNTPYKLLRSDFTDPYGEKMPMPIFADRAALSAQNFGWCFEANKAIALTCGTTNGSVTVTCANTKQIAVGAAVTGPGIPGGATVATVTPNVSFTISAPATATNAAAALTVTGNILSVREAMSVNVQTTTKAFMEAVYQGALGARALMYATTSLWENITFVGQIYVLNQAGQSTPQFWAKNCKFKHAGAHTLLVQGGYAYTQDCSAWYGVSDGANYTALNSVVCRGVEINYKTYFCGDVATYGTAQTLNPQGTGTNKNGSSNHDSYVVRVNGQHYYSYGPNVADTTGSYSWNLGVEAIGSSLTPNVTPGTPRYGFLNQGNNAWMDGCRATGQDDGFNSDSSASTRMFNCAGTRITTASGTFTDYTPT